jgi:EAL domain-containing protein (putative c-di-GMP-specific phosphodiesterase class I)
MYAPYLSQAAHKAAEPSVLNLMREGQLKAHFQPIIDLRQARVLAHEALIRTPADCLWSNPDALFTAARQQGHTIHLELECLRQALGAWRHT